MIHFFGDETSIVFAVQSHKELSSETISKLNWLFGNVNKIEKSVLTDFFVGPRASMITPWSTNAVEITQNMGINGILRIEEYKKCSENFVDFDPMLFQKYNSLNQEIFTLNIKPEPILEIDDIAEYNRQEGLALSSEEINYLEELSKKLNRKLTDSEVFGFSQVNSEHCRHKIFNGKFVIDGVEKEASLFELIKKTSKENPNEIVSAYKDNVAFINGPRVTQFAPKSGEKADYYEETKFDSVISLKAETHNFPTTVEPFNGAATGSGGEIRDRLAGGQGSLPLAGTAVYMTSYSRLSENRPWENEFKERKWLYQTPMDILIKASNGASDFGNKFGQPLITGSVLTFEHEESNRKLGFDKVIMLAGGIGYGKKEQSKKLTPKKGDKIVVLGGENYRIGMGGAAVSSADTGEFGSGIELNAIQRSNPEMQKRVANAIRALVESSDNPIISIHDHGAGGHLNCLSELVEATGGLIDLDKLPVGDPTLSAKEIIGNESQERIGLIISENDLERLKRIADRERAPMYVVGEVTENNKFTFESKTTGEKPMDLLLDDMFGSSPKVVMNDNSKASNFNEILYSEEFIHSYLEKVLRLEAVACKDWLTNKVDRCVGGKVAKQQCVGPIQLPLNNVGVMALDFKGKEGIATSIGHSPLTSLINPRFGSRNAIGEALSNIVFAPLKNGLKSVSLSANWMWACKNDGEDAKLYEAVEEASIFSIELGINIPTGKDSLSMKQKYPNEDVIAPGTVIISAAGNCSDVTKVVEPVFQRDKGSIYHINLSQDDFKLGGSSFGQVLNKIGNEAPTIKSAEFFSRAFNSVQELIKKGQVASGHDIGSGGLITTLLEMCFADNNLGAEIDFSDFNEKDLIKILFAENIGLVLQANNDETFESYLNSNKIGFHKIGAVTNSNNLKVNELDFNISKLRDIWFETSYLLDKNQSKNNKAEERYKNYKNQPLIYKFPEKFSGKLPVINHINRPKAAIIREKGSNSEREMANALFLAGFDVKDIHMTDLISGKENLEDVQFIAAVGGFSNSDVLGSAKGWAGSFKYNQKANQALKNFFNREDTLSIGICNGCQLFMELELINPEHEIHGKMHHNDSQKHESIFTSVKIEENNSIMLKSLAGLILGVWVSHGEGKFKLPYREEKYNIVGKYTYNEYPSNPNGSDYNTAMMCDKSGRHLVMMPHIERSIFPWNWAYYPKDLNENEISPWIEGFINAKNWLLKS
ncbi:phosphoribosylformylglycinamidine synthase [Flavobacterium sp.]|uniref:phosphoribosylformylglycinamidine synthase n=1 Tax=Flavobacterium sp. TaxID=239 RepID=UPI0035B276DB